MTAVPTRTTPLRSASARSQRQEYLSFDAQLDAILCDGLEVFRSDGGWVLWGGAAMFGRCTSSGCSTNAGSWHFVRSREVGFRAEADDSSHPDVEYRSTLIPGGVLASSDGASYRVRPPFWSEYWHIRPRRSSPLRKATITVCGAEHYLRISFGPRGQAPVELVALAVTALEAILTEQRSPLVSSIRG